MHVIQHGKEKKKNTQKRLLLGDRTFGQNNQIHRTHNYHQLYKTYSENTATNNTYMIGINYYIRYA